MNCRDFQWCKDRLGIDPTHQQHGFRPSCETCSNYDYEEDHRIELPSEQPIIESVALKALQQTKAEITHMHTEIHELRARRKVGEGLYR